MWTVFTPIFDKSKTYSEFKMRCELAGYTEPAYTPNYKMKCYEVYIATLSSYRYGNKPSGFREQMFAGFHRDSRII